MYRESLTQGCLPLPCQVRVRRFELLYHLEDDSLEIYEPTEPNSGLPQGRYLHRNK